MVTAVGEVTAVEGGDKEGRCDGGVEGDRDGVGDTGVGILNRRRI